MPDLRVQDHGSLCVLQADTVKGRQWVWYQFGDREDVRWWGTGVVVEPRYVDDIVHGARGDGLSVA